MRDSPARITARSRGFTLIEACMAIVITTILLVGMGSALTMTITGAEAGADTNARAAAAEDALSRIAAELSTATAWRQRTSSAMEFEVPDRDGDGAPEVIGYTWSGKGGAPMRRTYNGIESIYLEDVRAIDLTTIIRPVPLEVESAPRVLKECENNAFATRFTDVIDANLSAAQYLRPTLPSGAVSWKITGISIMLARSGAVTGNLRISIQSADSSRKPTGVVLASTILSESELPTTAAMVSVPISASGLSPTDGVCIVIDSVAGAAAVAAVTRYSGASTQPLNSHYMKQLGTGQPWSTPDDTLDMRFSATGAVTTLQEVE